MSLCNLCKSIPLDGLPPFPDEDVMRTLSGRPYLHHFYLRGKTLESVGFQHHPDLRSLRDAAAAGCGLCRLVETQVDGVLSDFDGMEKRQQDIYGKPQFDLWLTQLPNGRPGILVICHTIGKGPSAINPVAAIGFAAEEGDPMAAHFAGRPVRGILDQDTLSRIVEWVKGCDEHKGCQRSAGTLPPRLIDVSPAEGGGSLHIVHVDKKAPERYVALSHCYKYRDIAQVNLLPLSQEKVEMATLPKTFQDAVAITRNLGIKYLWIDELCIASQDAKGWARESASVGAVFANAYLTLAATGAKDTSEGLLLQRRPREYVRIEHTTAGDTKGQIVACTLPLDKEVIDSYYLDMQSEPLSQDVWAFQDRILSPRVLHFASDQVYLECQETFISEDGLEMSSANLHSRSQLSYIPQTKDAALSTWHGMLVTYSHRFPENADDKLPAMANVARAYAEILQDEYIAGMWKQDLVMDLAWQSLRRRDLAESSAPSWSWASFGGIAAGGRRENRTWEPKATIQDYHVEPEGSDSFGNVKEAWIKIEAPLVPLQLVEKTEDMGSIYLKTSQGSPDGEFAGLDLLSRKVDESGEAIKAMKIYCLVLGLTTPSVSECSTGGCTPSPCYHCIIVTPSGEGEGELFMKRIGFFLAGPGTIAAEEMRVRAVVTLK